MQPTEKLPVEPEVAARVAREIAIRDQNHRTAKAARNLLFGQVDDTYSIRIRCECSDDNCTELIRVPFVMASDGRQTENVFVIAAGHEHLDIEKVIQKNENYYLVEKNTKPAKAVEAMADPRSQVEDPSRVTRSKLNRGEDMGAGEAFMQYYRNLLG